MGSSKIILKVMDRSDIGDMKSYGTEIQTIEMCI